MVLMARVLVNLVLSLGVASSAGAAIPLAPVPLQKVVFVAEPPLSASFPKTVYNPGKKGTVVSVVSPATLTIAPIKLAKFNTDTGILVGATVEAGGIETAVRSSVRAVGFLPGAGSGAASIVTLSGSVSGTGFSTISNLSAVAQRTCNFVPSPATFCTQPIPPSTIVAGPILNGVRAVAASSLAAYAGVGSVALTRGASGSIEMITGHNAKNGMAMGSYTMSGGSYDITYDYLNFASPAFDRPNFINFLKAPGALDANSPVTVNFSIVNIGNANSAGLSLLGVERDFNTSEFSSNVRPFVNLEGGGANEFSLTFTPGRQGIVKEVFRFNLADHAPGGIGGRTYTLKLSMLGGTVPEPSSWAMLIMGFGLIGANARRHRGRAAIVQANDLATGV